MSKSVDEQRILFSSRSRKICVFLRWDPNSTKNETIDRPRVEMAYRAERAHRDTQVQIEGERREKQEAKRAKEAQEE